MTDGRPREGPRLRPGQGCWTRSPRPRPRTPTLHRADPARHRARDGRVHVARAGSGERVDARSDIFAFGAVLYEMLSGRRASGENTRVETLNAILKEEPRSLGEARRDLLPPSSASWRGASQRTNRSASSRAGTSPSRSRPLGRAGAGACRAPERGVPRAAGLGVVLVLAALTAIAVGRGRQQPAGDGLAQPIRLDRGPALPEPLRRPSRSTSATA